MFSARQPLYRGYLYCSGRRLDLLEKACATAADAVTIDLEDSVAAFDKEIARTAEDRDRHKVHPLNRGGQWGEFERGAALVRGTGS